MSGLYSIRPIVNGLLAIPVSFDVINTSCVQFDEPKETVIATHDKADHMFNSVEAK